MSGESAPVRKTLMRNRPTAPLALVASGAV